MRYYGVDLLDLWRGRLSLRRVAVLVDTLPPSSATAVAVHGERALWGPTEHLLATIVDVLQWANYQRSDPKKSTQPEPIARPGAAVASNRTHLSPVQLRDRLVALRDRRR